MNDSSRTGDLTENRGSPATVYDLDINCTNEDITIGEFYQATVSATVDYGIFVDLSRNISGLVHESVLDESYDVGDELIVELVDVRDNQDLSFEPVSPDDVISIKRKPNYTRVAAANLDPWVGERIHLEGEVVQIRQTQGPTLFRIRDETGLVQGAAFEDAGVRAHPDVKIGDYVHIMGNVEEHEETLQIEIETLDILGEESKATVQQRLDEAIAQRASPPEISPLVQWDVLEELHEDLRELATQLRRAVLENRPIRLRHHADGDGICASVPVQLALEQFIEETHTDPKAKQHLVRRLPSKAPFYEMEDATRDLNFSLQNQDKHGQKLPILFMLDNGSTKEDTSAYEAVKHYDIPIFVLDHHHPDPDAVEPFVDQHVNPYLIGEDYRITTGMMAVELARMISPAITDEVRHIPAVAGIADRSEADTMTTYLEIASDVGYSEDFLEDISEALDYIAYWLRYNPGNHLLNDILNVGGNEERHRDLVSFLARNARSEVEEQIDNAWPHLDQRYIADDILLSTIDVENYAYRFTYPAPGKTTGEIHDQIIEKEGTPAITIGYGPDFAVLRSDGVRLDIPRMVAELNEEIEGGGVQGGGHLVVGSIQFVSGMKDEVLDALIDKMAEAELDEEMKTQRPS